MNIQTALAHDRLEPVRANAGTLATAATALGAPAMKIDTAAVQLASATEIEDARAKFGTLSEAVVAYMDGLHLTTPERRPRRDLPDGQQALAAGRRGD